MSDTEQETSRKTAPTSCLCPKCGMRMRVAFVEPVDPEHERRLFDCSHLEIDLRRKPKLTRPVQIIPIVQSSKPPPPCDNSFMTQPCSIYELDENRCHWPLGSIEERATMFCGLNSEPERSYCWHHLRASKADEDCPR